MKFDVNTIKRIADCRELCSAVGLEPNAKGFVCCPRHAEKTSSCKVWRDHVHCFGCGWHGDVLDLACEVWQTDFQNAINMLAEMYGIAGEEPARIRQKQADAIQRRKARTARIDALRDKYFGLLAEYRRLDNNRARYAPRVPDEPLNPLFVEALTRIDAVEDDMIRTQFAWHDAERINTI